MSELTESSAKKLANLIKSKQVSCLEVMQAHLDRIAEVNPRINALVQVLPPELALQQARVADATVRRVCILWQITRGSREYQRRAQS